MLGIVEKSNDDWSLEDVLIKIVLPATEKSRKSFSRTIPVDQISPKFIFVAVPRSSCYHHLVMSKDGFRNQIIKFRLMRYKEGLITTFQNKSNSSGSIYFV